MLHSILIFYSNQFILPSHVCLCKLLRPPKITSSEDKDVQANRSTSLRDEELESYSWSECSSKNYTKYEYQRQSRNSPKKSVCNRPTKSPATRFDLIRRPSITPFSTEGSYRAFIRVKPDSLC